MLAWSPILIQKIEIQALEFVLRKLQLNRHREAEVVPHTHDFTQLILFLSGQGLQLIRDKAHEARAGDLFIIPPEIEHGYKVAGSSRPLCLVLDYHRSGRTTRVTHRKLPQQALNELHGLLAQVPTKGRPTLSDYPAIIAVIARLLEPSTLQPPVVPTTAGKPLVERVRQGLRDNRSLTELAKETGYVRDALSRKLKREHGLGLRALRDQERLQAAQAALLTVESIAEAATRAGFEDPNYFTRWFRKQTGIPPGHWRNQHRQ